LFLYGTASGLDFLSGSGADFIDGNDQGLGYFTIGQDLYQFIPFAYYAGSQQTFTIHPVAIFKLFEIRQADQGTVLFKNVRETSLGQTALQGHLTAFKTGPYSIAGSRLGSLVPTGGRSTSTGTLAAANPFPILC
jgi:hypothetical protein